VRWYGHRRVERFLERLCDAVREEDPGGLVTYVNYPPTEYLQLSFIDFLSFNVYLESQERLDAYMARLQNIAGDSPLVMGEIGLDSRRNGLRTQADILDWQVRTVFATGGAGAFVFSWTDEWYRGGHEIDDWDFGLTDRERKPKPALEAVSGAFSEIPYPQGINWPRVSVVVCSYNGGRTIADCLTGLLALDYPDFEVIVVNDGSTDATGDIAEEFGVRVITTKNKGLSSARNAGLQAATGEIVAYIDDDAYPDPHWLTYLAHTFLTTDHAAVGGPNIAPPGDGRIADCVASSPGGPVHVLLTDRVAEHIPGCNMAFRRSCLLEVGGFDPQYRVAGDDVDVCWRIQQRGWTLGFSPAATVWHHRRNSVRAYLKQQRSYGIAEAMLEKKWPEKYNAVGHLNWTGRLYGKGIARVLGWSRGRIYQGTWGSALFQSVYEPAPGGILALPLMPEWYLVVFFLTVLCLLGAVWRPMLFALPLLALSLCAPLAQAIMSAASARFSTPGLSRVDSFLMRALTASLHLLQPLARLSGRLRLGLTPWRRGAPALAFPLPHSLSVWSERWGAPEERLHAVETRLLATGGAALRGGDYDRWDLEMRGGMLGGARLLMALEEHGEGKQLVRFRLRPWCSPGGLVLTLLCAGLAVLPLANGAMPTAALLAALAVLLSVRTLYECAAATGAFHLAVRSLAEAAAERAKAVDPREAEAGDAGA
jgi:glycosyltransferase involved in cell wall biosynthesis